MIPLQRVAVAYVAFLLGPLLRYLIYHSRLPETVASHFNGAGRADGWMSRDAFMLLDTATTGMMALMMFVAYCVVALTSASMINLPNKQYWLAPERSDETRAWLASWMFRFGLLTLLFIQTAMFLTSEANLRPQPRLSNLFWLCLIAFLLYAVVGVVRMFLRFRLPSGEVAVR